MTTIDLQARTLPDILRWQAERRPDDAFLQFGRAAATTFGAVELRTNQLAHGLRGLGVGHGHRVAMILPNCVEIVTTWFALAKLGAVQVPINVELRGILLAHVLGNSGAEVLVCHREFLAVIAPVVNEQAALRTVVVVAGGVEDARAAGITADCVLTYPELFTGPSTSLDVDVSYTDPLAILYTSGTTGPAKGVVMPHHQYYVWVELYARSLQLTNDDSYFTPLPLFHADGQLWGVYFPLVFGTKGTFVERFSASRYWEQVRESGATATNMLGSMGHILWKQEPSARDADNPLRVAQALPMVAFKRDFEERFGLRLVTGYGQTETNWVSYDTPDQWRPGSCGKVADEHFEVGIVDDLDQPLPPHAIGEIVVRPKQPWSMSSGYHAMPDATLGAWRNLWFHSGDAGYLDEDGWLYFRDRIKDVIRRRGSNISAFELESVIDAHPLVQECAAVAVPSELSEDDVLVFVVVADGTSLDPAELMAYCREQLPRFMVPRYLDIGTERLPRTPTQKIAKPELRLRGVGPSTWDAEVAR
ncbi:AMP-binding protein [Sphaerisporangium sp. NPDC051017]|uniref:AMP-binding protein n=1 Tax=Sphaerisporangium sp. NPDC051017 TaxID=3154636 RepID=UPI003424BFDC